MLSAIASALGINRMLAALVAVLATLAIVAGLLAGVYTFVKHQGVAEERARIEKDNQDAIRKGIEASRSFGDCVAAGGMWDFRRQRCSQPAPGPR